MLLMSILLVYTREISTCCLGPASIRMVMLLVLTTIYQVIHTLQQKTTGLGSYTLTKVSTPSVNNVTPILSSRFNPTKKYPLDLNFYWASQKPT